MKLKNMIRTTILMIATLMTTLTMGISIGIAESDALVVIFQKARTATSDVEREAARDELRTYYKTSKDEGDREAIRQYFARNPSSSSGGSAVSRSGSSLTR